MGSRRPRLVYFQGIWLLVAILFLKSAAVAGDFRASPRPDFWTADGAVYSILATNGRVYIGGDFSYVAPKGSRLLALDRYTGEIDHDFPAIYGSAVHIILDDGLGGWFVGGDFVQVGTLRITNLVHIASDSSIDTTFRPDPDGAVQTLALDGTILYMGGDFNRVSGVARGHVAAWNLSNNQLTSWAPQANSTVSTLLLQGDMVFLGGYFASIGGQQRRNIAAVSASSAALLPWQPDADGAVLSLAFSGARLYAGGFFNRIGGQFRNGLAALDPNSTNALPWDPNPAGGKVTSVRADCSTIYVGGYFTNIAGLPRFRAAAIDGESAQALPWNPDLAPAYSGTLKSYVLSIEPLGSDIFVGGQFTAQGHFDFAQFDAGSGQVLPWNAGLDGGVSAIGISGRKVVVAVINSPGGVARRNLAAFDEFTGKALDWNPDPDGPVYALALSNGRLFMGGAFTNVGGVGRGRLAAVDLEKGSVDANWNASANNIVYALAANGSAVFVGGSFTALNGATRQRLCAVDDTTGAVLPTWVAHADGTVYSLALDNQILYAGGNFTSVSSIVRNHVAALDNSSAQVTAWNPGADGTVRVIAVSSGSIFLGGSFNSVASQQRNFVAKVDAATGLLTPWAPNPDDEIRAIAFAGTNVFLGGLFQHLNGESRFGLAAVTANGEVGAFNPSTSPANRVLALASFSALYICGESPLALAGDFSLQTLAAYPQVGAPQISGLPAAVDASPAGDVNFSPDVSGQPPISFQWRFAGTDLPGQTNSSLLLSNLQVNQSGVYELLTRNDRGGFTAQTRLTVVEPPVILAAPTAQTIAPGSTLNLAVLASANPPPLYQWRVNGANIPGAVFAAVTISNIAPAQAGVYDVVVVNRAGLAISPPANIVVTAPALPFADNRAAQGTITSLSGSGSGSNATATRETNEVLHAGKPGGHSVWITWKPPATGLATLSTRGSDFDTLLAVYISPTNPSNLVSVASDDDGGGFSASRLSFNASAGTQYQIAVDGAYGATGRIVLNWNLDTTSGSIPIITGQPQSQAVFAGDGVLFSVTAGGSGALRYQWFFGCQQIPNATNSTLLLPNVQSRDVGNYHVVVSQGGGAVAQSADAALEIGSRSDFLSKDKLQDLFPLPSGNGPSSLDRSIPTLPPAALASSGGFLLVSMGSINSQILNNTGSTTQPGEPSHCGVLGGASKWIGLHTTDSGVLVVDTIGSRIDTVLAVYTGTSPINLQEVACDDNGAPDHVRSLLHFNAAADTDYLVAADGVNGAQGSIVLNWKLGLPPVITSRPATNILNPGDPLTLTVQFTGSNAFTTFQWLCNGTNVPGATDNAFTLPPLLPGASATYSVRVKNPFGSQAQFISRILVRQPPFQRAPSIVNGMFRIWLPSDPVQMFDLEGSSDLRVWYWLESFPDANNPAEFRDYPLDDNLNFFRAVPWP